VDAFLRQALDIFGVCFETAKSALPNRRRLVLLRLQHTDRSRQIHVNFGTLTINLSHTHRSNAHFEVLRFTSEIRRPDTARSDKGAPC
jgi:hypothetical protein